MPYDIVEIDSDHFDDFADCLSYEAINAFKNKDSAICGIGVLSDEKVPYGAVCARKSGDCLTVFHLFVREDQRRQGIGKKLLTGMIEMRKHTDITLSWCVKNSDYDFFIQFLKKQGFGDPVDIPYPIYRITSDELKNKTILRSAFSDRFHISFSVVPYREFTAKELQELQEDENIPENLRISHFSAEQLNSPFCLGYRYDNQIQAYMLVENTSDNQYVILAAVTRKNVNPAAFLQLMTAQLYTTIRANGGRKCIYWFTAISEQSKRFAVEFGGKNVAFWKMGHCTFNAK